MQIVEHAGLGGLVQCQAAVIGDVALPIDDRLLCALVHQRDVCGVQVSVVLRPWEVVGVDQAAHHGLAARHLPQLWAVGPVVGLEEQGPGDVGEVDRVRAAAGIDVDDLRSRRRAVRPEQLVLVAVECLEVDPAA